MPLFVVRTVRKYLQDVLIELLFLFEQALHLLALLGYHHEEFVVLLQSDSVLCMGFLG